MKAIHTIAIVAALVSGAATAESFAYLPNKGGGKIILTSNPCQIKGAEDSFEIVTSSQEVGPVTGCWNVWKHDKSQIIVLWSDDYKARTYPIKALRKMNE